jgi:diguanylate cyclase (GGDEF)-like protein
MVSVVVVTTALSAIAFWLDNLVEHTLLAHAQSSAERWRNEFTSSVPSLPALLSGEDVSMLQRQIVEATMAGSDIFRFKLFDDVGNLVFISDKDFIANDEAASFNQTALDVMNSRANDVAVANGQSKADRPDWYVEAYIPIGSGDAAQPIGVVEVYVDVSGLATALRTKFNWLSVLLLGSTAAMYLIPTILLVRRNQQLRQRDQQLLDLSRLDALTGLTNRGAFNQKFSDLIEKRRKRFQDIGVFFIDLDKFKDVNDTLGHDVGDQLLKHVANLLRMSCRKNDLVARLGGDEFVIVMPNATREAVDDIAERLMLLSQTPFRTGSKEIWPGFSIGGHISPPGETEQRALHCADLAVYKAKANGRGQIVMYTGDLEAIENRKRAVSESIKKGLKSELFYLEFQPIFDRAQALAGFEALLRLRTENGQIIAPSEFIPVAEEIGVIADLGIWTLKAAIAAALDWPDHTFVAVNVSAHEFRSGNLPIQLEKILASGGIDPSRVCLELTEGTLLENNVSITEQLVDLKALGVVLALDDFGTGYSSLGYLWRYEFDRLKIDRSFLEGFAFDEKRYRKIIETIVLLGHQLDMVVTVEGVEHSHQLTAMLDLGSDYFQGFHLSRPISLEAANSFVANEKRAGM